VWEPLLPELEEPELVEIAVTLLARALQAAGAPEWSRAHHDVALA
jgi:hypothetical protein